MSMARQARSGVGRQGLTGLSLATLIITAWAVGHVYGVFLFRWTPIGIAFVPALIALQCWLSVGLFIVAHDAMHGSLVPFRPGLNRRVGQLCLFLYAGFAYDRLIGAHFAHHRHSGTADDPDFHHADPRHFWRWYATFFARYFGWRPAAWTAARVALYMAVFGASPANLLVLWALPALLSSVQLFYFGTYLPHRHEDDAFTNRHNSRSSDLSWLMSLLTCFHFGYHHEHHDAPHVPWWALPSNRAASVPLPVDRMARPRRMPS